MWLAVCSHGQCQWVHEAVSRASAEGYLRWHNLKTGHWGAVVCVPVHDLLRAERLNHQGLPGGQTKAAVPAGVGPATASIPKRGCSAVVKTRIRRWNETASRP